MKRSLKVMQPEEMNAAFAEAFNASDIDMLVGLYEPEAVLSPLPGKTVRGLEEIRGSHLRLLGFGGRLEAHNLYCMQAGELALLRGAWRLAGAGADGKTFEFAGHSAEVLRRQPDGSWLYIIDNAHADRYAEG